MKKEELIKHIASELGIPKTKVNQTINRLVEVIYRETKNGGYVRLSKLGTFRGKKRKSRLIIDPNDNRTYLKQQGASPDFKPSQIYRDYLSNKDI